MEEDKRSKFLSAQYERYVVQYRGNFLEQVSKVDYAFGFIITKKMAILCIKEDDIHRTIKDIPSILLIDYKTTHVLQEIPSNDVSNINYIKQNEYLSLNGSGVLIGLIDTGIDYLNKEFWYEDDTTRILSIWDQDIDTGENSEVYIGTIYNREEINEAIRAKLKGEDPYSIVPSKDEIGHGTKMAGIIGARGYDEKIRGIADNCEFVVVKLQVSKNIENNLIKNGVTNVPVYFATEILAALQYLSRIQEKEDKPMVVFLPLGTPDSSHDGYTLLARYVNEISIYERLVVVTGSGNEGDSEGHVKNFIEGVGVKKVEELSVPKILDNLRVSVWIRKPNKMSINIISPSGEKTGEIKPKDFKSKSIKFFYDETEVNIKFFIPEANTGHEAIDIKFKDIKPGIWKFEFKGEYIVDGKFDMWLPAKITLPDGVKFLAPSPETTLVVPGSAKYAITASYYDSSNNSIVASSGKGYNINDFIKPNIAAPGVNILTTTTGGGKAVVSGSSVAAAIISGICALLFQWGIVNKNDIYMNSTKVRGYLINGAIRDEIYTYPNENWGYGRADFKGIFASFNASRQYKNEKYNEYYVGKLLIRIPRKFAKRVGDK